MQVAKVAKRVRVMLCGTVSGRDAAVELTGTYLQRVQEGIIRACVYSQHRQMVIMRTADLWLGPVKSCYSARLFTQQHTRLPVRRCQCGLLLQREDTPCE